MTLSFCPSSTILQSPDSFLFRSREPSLVEVGVEGGSCLHYFEAMLREVLAVPSRPPQLRPSAVSTQDIHIQIIWLSPLTQTIGCPVREALVTGYSLSQFPLALASKALSFLHITEPPIADSVPR